jgi:4-amino-4-deoxy-L-arabinose transferase-like glycosyltransferase
VRDRWLTAGVFAVVVALLFVGLGSYGLWDPDEGRHSEIARELFNATSWQGWLVPSRNFAPYHDKPILYYWLAGAAYGLVGPSELGARLVSALAALATTAILFAWTATVWDRATARAVLLVLVSSIGFLGLGRYGSLDMLLTCWLTLGLTAAERWTAAPDRRGWLYVVAVAAALGMLTKGLVAPLFLAAIPLAAALIERRRIPLAPGGYLGPLAVFVAVAAPWYAVAGVLDPSYLRDFFLVHHLERFANEESNTFHPNPWWYYGPALALMLFPWSFLLPATLRAAWGRRDPATRYCFVWSAVVVGFFSCSHGKLATYVLPAIPPLAVVTGRAAVTTSPGRLAAIGVGALVALLVSIAPLAVFSGGLNWPYVLVRIRPALWVLPVAGVVLGLVWWRRGTAGALRAIAFGTMGIAAIFYVGVAPTVSDVAGEKTLATIITSREPAPVIAFRVRASSLLFYTERPVLLFDRPKQVRDVIESRPFVWIVTSAKHVDDLSKAGAVFPWRTDGHHVLYATAPPTGAPPALAGDSTTRVD